MLETNPSTFRDLLTHVRDNPGSPFLFHCTGTAFLDELPGINTG